MLSSPPFHTPLPSPPPPPHTHCPCPLIRLHSYGDSWFFPSPCFLPAQIWHPEENWACSMTKVDSGMHTEIFCRFWASRRGKALKVQWPRICPLPMEVLLGLKMCSTPGNRLGNGQLPASPYSARWVTDLSSESWEQPGLVQGGDVCYSELWQLW